MKKDKASLVFEKYISERNIVIADPNASSRAGLARALVNMGAKTIHVSLAPSFTVAVDCINEKKPHVVLCDYDLGGGRGLDLLQAQRVQRPESRECLFVLITGNTSQSAVARAAEEDVDSYILKPYTLEVLRNCIMSAALTKIKPSDYIQTIEAGKGLLQEGKFDEAIKTFEKAMQMDSQPALACFYLGQTELMKKLMDEAEGRYEKGLGYNKIHYKCLTGLYDLLYDQKKYADAYDVIKKISRY